MTRGRVLAQEMETSAALRNSRQFPSFCCQCHSYESPSCEGCLMHLTSNMRLLYSQSQRHPPCSDPRVPERHWKCCAQLVAVGNGGKDLAAAAVRGSRKPHTRLRSAARRIPTCT